MKTLCTFQNEINLPKWWYSHINVKPPGHDGLGKNTAAGRNAEKDWLCFACFLMMAAAAALSGNWRVGFVLGDTGLKANSAKLNTLLGSCQKRL